MALLRDCGFIVLKDLTYSITNDDTLNLRLLLRVSAKIEQKECISLKTEDANYMYLDARSIIKLDGRDSENFREKCKFCIIKRYCLRSDIRLWAEHYICDNATKVKGIEDSHSYFFNHGPKTLTLKHHNFAPTSLPLARSVNSQRLQL